MRESNEIFDVLAHHDDAFRGRSDDVSGRRVGSNDTHIDQDITHRSALEIRQGWNDVAEHRMDCFHCRRCNHDSNTVSETSRHPIDGDRCRFARVQKCHEISE